MANENTKHLNPDAPVQPEPNRDAITGAPGSHPVGTGVGAAGAGAAGAALGSIAGPIGTAVGAVIGAVAGGLAGKGVAESVNPTLENEYWEQNYKTRPYVMPGLAYHEIAPAYQYGWESSSKYAGKDFDEVEPSLQSNWEATKAKTSMGWDKAKLAAKDAWEHVAPRSHSNVNAHDESWDSKASEAGYTKKSIMQDSSQSAKL